jgi:hypothetical protein
LSAGTPLYAVLDAAREPEGPLAAHKAGLRVQSLYEGKLGDMLKSVAPHLIDFGVKSSFRDWWFGRWGKSVGILVETPASLSEVRKHFRTLTIVRGEDRSRYYFRFYDPRVLRAFLPACSAEEAARFFGPITAIHCEGSGDDEVLTFTRGADGIEVKSQRLSGEAMPVRR